MATIIATKWISIQLKFFSDLFQVTLGYWKVVSNKMNKFHNVN